MWSPVTTRGESLGFFFEAMEALEGQLPVKVSYVLVGDGSKDDTLSVMCRANAGRPGVVHYISFSRNFGKEAALPPGCAGRSTMATTSFQSWMPIPKIRPCCFPR